MSVDREESPEAFLNRWSRLKKEARTAAPEADIHAPAKADPAEPAPELPPLDQLTMDSDFSGFFHPKVDEGVRRAALRKLFSDPHFNVMDGLDVYIDDYSISEPIPAAMLASMKQAQRILNWAANKEDEPAEEEKAVGSVEETGRVGAALEAPQSDSCAQPPVAEVEAASSPQNSLPRCS